MAHSYPPESKQRIKYKQPKTVAVRTIVKILISSIEDQAYATEIEVGELHYDREKEHFSMQCVMGDDWFQRVTSPFDFSPQAVRFADRVTFVVFSLTNECDKFYAWLVKAEDQVREGYRTMRG